MRPANHHGAPAAGEGTGQPRNRLFERHRITQARQRLGCEPVEELFSP